MQRFLLIILISIMAGCSSKSGPETTLQKFIKAKLAGKNEEAYQYISSKDKEEKSLSKYRLESVLTTQVVIFKVLKVVEKNNKAGVTLSITLPKKTKEETYILIKEDNKWKVFLNWKAKRLAKEKAEKLAKKKEEKRIREKLENQKKNDLDPEFLMINGVVYYKGQKINTKEFKKFLLYFKNEKRPVALLFDEETTTNGFFTDTKDMVSKMGIIPTVKTVNVENR
jgi:nitrogen fixation protein